MVWARSLTRGLMSSLARMMSLISIAWVWCSIIMVVNITSASLKAAAVAAGGLGVGVGVVCSSAPAQPARVTVAASAIAAIAAKRFFMCVFSKGLLVSGVMGARQRRAWAQARGHRGSEKGPRVLVPIRFD